MTAQELLQIARNGRPNVRYAVNAKGNAIGAYSEKLGRFCVVAMLDLTGRWTEMGELLINGQPIPQTWIE